MNTKRTVSAFALLFAAFALVACGGSDNHDHAGSGHDDHGHASASESAQTQGDKEFAKEPGPNGGRLVTSIDPAVELVVTEDRKVKLSFFDEQREPTKPGPYEFAIIGGDRNNPTRLEFESSGGNLLSKGSLPAGEGFPVMLEITNTKDGSVTRERFNFASHTCSGCGLQEYACICGH